MRTINVGIGFATGRPNFKALLRTYVRDWASRGHADRVNLHLIVAYDLTYCGADKQSFVEIEPEITKSLASVSFLGDDDVPTVVDRLSKQSGMPVERGLEFFGHGYAGKRNLILYHAVEQELDYLLFLDDDEYPIVPIKNSHGTLSWIGQDVLGTHLKHLPGAEVTVGYHSGYISPIPFIDDFNKDFREEDFRLFVEAISNDIIDWNTIRAKFSEHQGVTYGHLAVIRDKPVYEIKTQRSGKWVAGSNLGLNLRRIERIPAFYNPPGARGEDTFFSTRLTEATVKRVPCYTFHDGFLRYLSILNGVLPEQLGPVLPNDDAVIQRFMRATNGWVAYKPLLVYVTQRSGYLREMTSVRTKLARTAPRMAAYLEQPDFLRALDVLARQDQEVVAHYEQFVRVQEYWVAIRGALANVAI